jgi:predicted dithiol-disulfide oxidoreductase (DUF899 family)
MKMSEIEVQLRRPIGKPARGVEQLMGTFGYTDVAPLGRNEDPQNPGAWWRRHDEYASH